MVTPLFPTPEYPAAKRAAVIGLNGFYSATSDGDIVSHRAIEGRVPPFARADGHLYVTLFGADRQPRILMLARLILEAFGHPAPTTDAVPVFKDGDRRNCALDNLSWGVPDDGSSRASGLNAGHTRPVWGGDNTLRPAVMAVLVARRRNGMRHVGVGR